MLPQHGRLVRLDLQFYLFFLMHWQYTQPYWAAATLTLVSGFATSSTSSKYRQRSPCHRLNRGTICG